MLVINNPAFIKRAEVIREKGTNRSAFFRGEVDKYNWVDIGSSFLPSDIIAAFLFAQLENVDTIQAKRKYIWNLYYSLLEPLQTRGKIKIQVLPSYATNNGHMFYILCENIVVRTQLINYLKENKILSVFHYLSLHDSSFYRQNNNTQPKLIHSDTYSDCLLRLPLYFELTNEEINFIGEKIYEFYNKA